MREAVRPRELDPVVLVDPDDTREPCLGNEGASPPKSGMAWTLTGARNSGSARRSATTGTVWHPEVKFAATRAIVVPEPISRGMEAAHHAIDGTKVPANKAFSKRCGIRAGHAKNRRSFTPVLATKDAHLQVVF
jgi:hypothetical protein